MLGNGISWLKSNRLRKLLEDEAYRNLTITKLNRALNRKARAEEYVEDLVRLQKDSR